MPFDGQTVDAVISNPCGAITSSNSKIKISIGIKIELYHIVLISLMKDIFRRGIRVGARARLHIILQENKLNSNLKVRWP